MYCYVRNITKCDAHYEYYSVAQQLLFIGFVNNKFLYFEFKLTIFNKR